MENVEESIMTRLNELTIYALNFADDYGAKFHECIKTKLGSAKCKDNTIPIMDVKHTSNYDDNYNEYYCNRVVAYFNAQLRNSNYIAKWDYNKRYHKYQIVVVSNSNLVHKNNDLNITERMV